MTTPKIAEEYDPLAGITPQEYQRLLQAALGAPPPPAQVPPPAPNVGASVAPALVTGVQRTILTATVRTQILTQTGFPPMGEVAIFHDIPEWLRTGTLPPMSPVTPGVPGQINWFFVRRRNEYPGNHPDYGVLRQIGLNGILTEVDDPLLVPGMGMDRANGFAAGVWIDPGKYGTPQGAADHLKEKLGDAPVDAIALDPETGNVAKGIPGSAQWNYSQDLAIAFSGAFPGETIFVTPTPLQDDFNYAAYLDSGQDVWVQTYGSDTTVLFDPVQVVNRVIANGVPVSRIGALISPLQIPTAPPALAVIGVTKIAVYTSDGLTPEVVAAAAPFPPTSSTPPPETTPADETHETEAPEETTPEETPEVDTPDVDYTTPLDAEVAAWIASESVEETDSPVYDDLTVDLSFFAVTVSPPDEDQEGDDTIEYASSSSRLFRAL